MSLNETVNPTQPEAESSPLVAYQADVYSQNGEDGILAEVFRRLGAQHALDRWCVEFGAWDGVYLSNTARLIREDGYRAVLIEGDPARASSLATTHVGAQVIPITAFVGFDQDDGLDSLLRQTPIPIEFDLLSVDIDGCDYHVWEAVQHYRPKVVIIEYNWTMPNAVTYVQPRDQRINHGSSAAALIELGSRKGYVLVATTQTNIIFVGEEYADSVLGPQRPTLADVRNDADAVCYVYFGQDGTVLTSRPLTLPWSFTVRIPSARLQVVPKPLRRYRGGDRPMDKAMRLMTAFTVTPRGTTKLVLERWRSRR